MGLAGWLARPLRPKRTVRLRLTAMYSVLFLLSGAALLALAAGLDVSQISVVGRTVTHAGHGGAVSPAIPQNSASSLQLQVDQLRAALAEQAQTHTVLSHQLLEDSAIALAVMLVVAAVIGWLLAGRAVRPLSLITSTARRISEHNLNERLAFRGPKDELKDLADTIDGLLERLEAAFNAQRLFVANASHELRTPLTTMRASLDVATAKPGVPQQTTALAARLRAELDQVDELLEGLLVLARVQHGALPDTAVFPLSDLVAAAVSARQAAIAASNLTVRADTARDGTWVQGSEALIGRMVGNIIDNAIVHNQQGGWISVTVDADDRAARVAVENGGAVLDQQQVAQLGLPFRRIGADRTGSDKGSGLGLSIVAAIAAAHGGTLDLQARPSGGLLVTVTLPLSPPPPQTGAPT
jgi:signal transduction histidine kinase